jgi:ABC-type sugar transport system permease subunit
VRRTGRCSGSDTPHDDAVHYDLHVPDRDQFLKLFDQNLSLTAGEPGNMSELLALNIYDTFYGRTGWQGVGQAKAVVFFILVAGIAMLELTLTRAREVQQ